MIGKAGLVPWKRLYVKQPPPTASAAAEPLPWPFGLLVAGYKYKITHTPCNRPRSRSGKRAEALRTAKEWDRPDTVWTDGSRQEDSAVGAACVWRSPEGGWTGRRIQLGKGRYGGQIQGNEGVDLGARTTRVTL